MQLLNSIFNFVYFCAPPGFISAGLAMALARSYLTVRIQSVFM